MASARSVCEWMNASTCRTRYPSRNTCVSPPVYPILLHLSLLISRDSLFTSPTRGTRVILISHRQQRSDRAESKLSVANKCKLPEILPSSKSFHTGRPKKNSPPCPPVRKYCHFKHSRVPRPRKTNRAERNDGRQRVGQNADQTVCRSTIFERETPVTPVTPVTPCHARCRQRKRRQKQRGRSWHRRSQRVDSACPDFVAIKAGGRQPSGRSLAKVLTILITVER